MLPRLRFSLQGLPNNHNGLDFLQFLRTELISQLAGSHASVPQNIRMMSGETAKLSNVLAFLSERMGNADLTVLDSRMPLDLLLHHSVRLSQEVDTLLEGPPRPAMEQ